MNHKDAWSQIQYLPPRQKAVEVKKLAQQIVVDLKSNQIDLGEFDILLQILTKADLYDGKNGRYSRVRNLLIRERLKSLGLSEVTILKKINGAASIESGLVGLADLRFTDDLSARCADSKDLEALVSEGKCVYVETGGDGVFDVQLRLVEGNEPMLSEKEYKLVESSSDSIEINCPTGQIGVGDLAIIDGSSVHLTVEPGTYKACGYVFDNHKGFRAYYFVVSKKNN